MRPIEDYEKFMGDIASIAKKVAEEEREIARERRRRRQGLEGAAIDLLKEDLQKVESELAAARHKALGHDKQVMGLAREARGAREDAEVLLEALSLFAQTVDNSKREWRSVRERARKLLESRGIPPPSSLGSSRSRERWTKTTKTT